MFLVPGCEVRCDISIKRCSIRLYNQLIFVCVCLCVVVSNTSCLYEQPGRCHVLEPWFALDFRWGPCCSSLKCSVLFVLCLFSPSVLFVQCCQYPILDSRFRFVWRLFRGCIHTFTVSKSWHYERGWCSPSSGVGDISRIWSSYLGHLVFLLVKTFNLFRF